MNRWNEYGPGSPSNSRNMTTQYPPQNPHYQPSMPPPAAPEPPKKRGRVHWAWLIAVFFVGVFFGNLGGGSSTSSQTAASAPTRQAPAAVQPAPQQTQAPAGPKTEWGDGTWIVGVDIQPGKYESSGAKSGFFELCTASTKKGASSNSDNIDWLTANADERLVIEITSEAKAFVNNNCEPFRKIG